MAIQTPGCCDSEWQLLFKILQSLPDIAGGGGSGDVTGPGSSTNNDIATFNGATGKIIKDSGVSISSLITTANLQSGSNFVGIGLNSLAIVFPTPFASAPHVSGTVGHLTGEAQINANILTDTVTTLGFTVRLNSVTPSATYKYNWIAHI